MPSPKPIQIILARQLASSLAMPILIVDTEGTLIFYNEPAEVILDQRFEETGEMTAEAWSGLFAVADEARNPIAQEDRPMMMALSERKLDGVKQDGRSNDNHPARGEEIQVTFPVAGAVNGPTQRQRN